ncbi:hypothetical protein BKA64DRAFT_772001 [Cadophora sp. MPI-SDFR-AT-0126]|nr:hypothetical protein BKA64DRAFT_772001 [Leotiomycetes sp. MPI-SDFR-AT-0126]
MVSDHKKSAKGETSNASSKPGKKPKTILDSLLHSMFTNDIPRTQSAQPPKHTDGEKSNERQKKSKRSTSEHTTKSTKASRSKHATEAAEASNSKSKSKLLPSKLADPKIPSSKLRDSKISESETFLNSTFFKDESRAPALIPSATPELTTSFTSEHDRKMATRQLQINTLSETELQEQENWAQMKLFESGSCPMGWGWQRYTAPEGYAQFDGYRCCGGASTHLVTHELLAEGKNRLYRLSGSTNWWEGPFDAQEVRDMLLASQAEAALVNQEQGLSPRELDELLREVLLSR